MQFCIAPCSEIVIRQVPLVMYAIIETGGKQYRVQEGDTVFIEKLGLDEGESVSFDKGTPYVDGAKVTAKILKNGKGKKVIVFKYKAKKNYRRKKGHRQPYTKVQIEKIEA